MSVKLLKSPFEDEFKTVLSQAKREIIFSSPYINDAGIITILNSVNNLIKKKNHILTNLSVRNIIDNITQPLALLKMYAAFQTTTVSSLEKLHAKGLYYGWDLVT
jgi:hypothetical protein